MHPCVGIFNRLVIHVVLRRVRCCPNIWFCSQSPYQSVLYVFISENVDAFGMYFCGQKRMFRPQRIL